MQGGRLPSLPAAGGGFGGSMRSARDGTSAKAGARQTGPALEAHYRFLLWLVPTVEKFPKSQKFLLGDRIQVTALDVLERLIEATYSRRRQHHLAAANLDIEKLRFFFRLAMDLRFLDLRRHEHAVRTLDEVGRLIGGWAKTDRSFKEEEAQDAPPP